MPYARPIAATLAALWIAVPLAAAAAGGEARREVESRPLEDGYLYVGAAPGFDFGGRALPRALYMDVVQAGYVLPSGIDLSFALSGMNFFPDEGDYAITMGRFALGYRPFLRDPLPVIQPYALVGFGVGGEGRYVCQPEPDCDPEKNVCRDVCERANWVGSIFGGAGIDLNAHLAYIAGQQLLLFGGVQARYEWIPNHYRMPVITFPIGLRLQ
jgi:hypothetical protein